VMWAYDGFADLTFASGEVKDPQRNLPRAIIIGTLLIIGIYLTANAAYLYINPIGILAKSPLISADTMGTLFGQIGVSFVSVIVMISTFGSLMGSMLASPRIFFAMADDKLLFEPIARVHPTRRTPYGARRRHGDDADVRAADRHVRAGDVAVLRAQRRGNLHAAEEAA
jgi:basic amino acid/polyamine antiporter, APA family